MRQFTLPATDSDNIASARATASFQTAIYLCCSPQWSKTIYYFIQINYDLSLERSQSFASRLNLDDCFYLNYDVKRQGVSANG